MGKPNPVLGFIKKTVDSGIKEVATHPGRAGRRAGRAVTKVQRITHGQVPSVGQHPRQVFPGYQERQKHHHTQKVEHKQRVAQHLITAQAISTQLTDIQHGLRRKVDDHLLTDLSPEHKQAVQQAATSIKPVHLKVPLESKSPGDVYGGAMLKAQKVSGNLLKDSAKSVVAFPKEAGKLLQDTGSNLSSASQRTGRAPKPRTDIGKVARKGAGAALVVGGVGGESYAAKTLTATAAEKVAARGGAKLAAKEGVQAAKQTVKEAPAKTLERVRTKPARTVESFKSAPERARTAPRRAVQAVKTTPVRTAARVASAPVRHPAKAGALYSAGALPLAVTQKGKKHYAPVELAKAQVHELTHHTGDYVKNTGKFVPGAITGGISLGLGVAEAPFTHGKSATEASKALVESNKQFLDYLSADPKKQKTLAKEFGAGPLAVAALPAIAKNRAELPEKTLQKSATEKTLGGGRIKNAVAPVRRLRLNRRSKLALEQDIQRATAEERGHTARLVQNIEHGSKERSVLGKLVTGQAHRTPRVRGKSTFIKLDRQHQDAAALLLDGRVSMEPRQAMEDLSKIVRDAKQGKEVPGVKVKPETAKWLHDKIEESHLEGKNFLKDSGIQKAFEQDLQPNFQKATLNPETGLGQTEQAVRREAPHMQDRGVPIPSQAREVRIKEAESELLAAKKAKVNARQVSGVATEKGKGRAKLRKRYQRTSHIEDVMLTPRQSDKLTFARAEPKLAGQRVKDAQKNLLMAREPVTSKEQLDFIRSSREQRKAAGRPEPVYTKQEGIGTLPGESGLEVPKGRGVGTRFRKRFGKTQAKGQEVSDWRRAIQSGIVDVGQRNKLVDVANAGDRWNHQFTREETATLKDHGVQLHSRELVSKDSLPKLVASGVIDPKQWVWEPSSKRTQKLIEQDPTSYLNAVQTPVHGDLLESAARFPKETQGVLRPRAIADEYHSVVARTARGEFGRKLGTIQSAAILGTSPFWVPAQVLAEGIPAAIDLMSRGQGPRKAIQGLQAYARAPEKVKAQIDASSGQAHGLGQSSEIQSNLRNVDKKAVEEAGTPVWKRPNVRPWNYLRQADRWKGQNIRRAVTLSRTTHEFSKLVDKQKETLQAVMDGASKAKHVPIEKQYSYLKKNHPAIIKRIEEGTRDTLGDWSAFTRREQWAASWGFFYPMVRYTTSYVLSTFPRSHPLVSTIAYAVGIQNTQQVEKLVGGEPGFFNQLMQAVRYGHGKPQLVDVSRITPGGNAANEAALTGLDPSSALKLVQPVPGAMASTFLNKDPRTGKSLYTDPVTGDPLPVTPGEVGKVGAATAAGLPSFVHLADNAFGPLSKTTGGRRPDQLPFSKVKKYPKGPSTAFYDQTLPTGKQKAMHSILPPTNTQPAWKQKALTEMSGAKKTSGKMGKHVKGMYAPDLRSALRSGKIDLKTYQKRLLEGLKARGLMAQLEDAANKNRLEQFVAGRK